MAITFSTIPSSNRVPGVYAEFVPFGSTSSSAQNTLLVAQMTPAGIAAAGQPVQVNSADAVATLAGPGSQAHQMAKTYFGADSSGVVYLLPLADASGATKAAATVTITGTATAAGLVTLQVDGQVVQTGVAAGDSAASIQTRLMAAFSNTVTSFAYALATGVITLTAKNGGTAGNDLDIRVVGNAPAGITVANTAFSGGGGDPDLAAPLAAMGDLPVDFIALPFATAAALDAVKVFLADRWSWSKGLFGQAFAGARGTVGSLSTLGLSRNDPYTSIIGANGSPDNPAVWAAAFAAAAAVSMRADAALPLNGLPLNVQAPARNVAWAFSDRQALLYAGISTFKLSGSAVLIDRAITTSQTISGVPSDAELNVERISTLTAVARLLIGGLAANFARRVLVSDDDTIPAGSNRVNARMIRAYIIASYMNAVNQGLASDVDSFSAGLVVENQGRGKIAVYWPGTLANQLEQVGIQVAFSAA